MNGDHYLGEWGEGKSLNSIAVKELQKSRDKIGFSSISYLPASSFDHKFSGQMGGWLWLKRSDHDALVQGITRHNL